MLTGNVPAGLGGLATLNKAYFSLNGITGGLENQFCGGSQKYFSELVADCAGDNPEVECSCCTICCDEAGTECVVPIVAPTTPAAAPTLPPAQANARFSDFVVKFSHITEEAKMNDPNSDEHKAVMWLAQTDPAQLDPDAEELDTIVQRYVITLLYYATDGENWKSQASFLTSNNVCDWTNRGIQCDSLGLILEIEIDNVGLAGTLPREIGFLENLKVLILDNNMLTGAIPSEIGLLTALQELDLSEFIFSSSFLLRCCPRTNSFVQ